jgi:F420-non-reducing hydrogenase iron-sulfur subunit
MANKRMTFLKKLLEFSGIHPERLRMRWVSSAEAAEFVHEISEFVEEIKKLGPNPLKAKRPDDKVKVEVQVELGAN